MPKVSGGGGNGGRTGSGGGDAGQPGEVVREANKANTLVIGGIPIKKGMPESKISEAHGELLSQVDRKGLNKEAEMKSFVNGLRNAGIKKEDYEKEGRAYTKIERWYSKY